MDRLSELPDDLIQRVLHFAPAKEAASSGAISRRFRSLWRSSTDAVNLEARALEEDNRYGRRNTRDYEARFLYHRDGFVSAAKAALDAPDGRLTRLSFRLQARSDDKINDFLHRHEDRWSSNRNDAVADVLSHPKARLVEELQIAMDYNNGRVSFDHEVSSYGAGVYTLGLESLPSETLRVLDLSGCQIFEFPAAGVALPRLMSLRMDNSSVPLEHLQSLIFAAPALHAVRLESVCLRSYEEEEEEQGTVVPVRLHFPVVTWLVMDKCGGWPEAAVELEIHAPKLRRFRYKGLLRKLSLCPQPPPDLSLVDLHFFSGYEPTKDPCRDHVLLWQFFQTFRSTKEFKLLVQHLEDIAIVDGAERARLLRLFHNLERLELGGVHRPEGKTAAVAIANLLRCCPAVRDLQINLTTTKANSHKQHQHVGDFLKRKSRDDLQNSIQHFLRRRLERPVLSPEGEGDNNIDEVADIPALTGRSFRCLQHSLRRVSLRFQPEKSNCFGMKLIKFFVENAAALEEIRIDGGNNRMNEHINRKVERWIVNSSHKRNTGRLTVLPLKR